MPKKLSAERLAQVNSNAQKMLEKGYSQEDIKEMSAVFFEKFAEEDTPQQSQQPTAAANQPAPQTQQPNLQKVGDKTFDSNTAQKILTDIDGNDILQVDTGDGLHGVVRKSDGSYDWYRGNIESDKIAAGIKGTINNPNATKPQLSGKLSDTYRLTTSSGDGTFGGGSDYSAEAEEIQNSQIKKAADAVVNKDKNIDEVAFDNATNEKKENMWFKTAQQQQIEEQDNLQDQRSLKEYEYRRRVINEQNDAIRYTTESVVNGLQSKYGDRFKAFLDFSESGAQQYLDELAKAKAAKDATKFNAILQEYNNKKDSFSDIQDDPNFRVLGDFNEKLDNNKNRVTELLVQDNFKAARELANYEYAKNKRINFVGELNKEQENKDWNSGVIGKAKSIASQTKTAISAIPEIVGTSIRKIPIGAVTAVKIATDMIGLNDPDKVDILSGLQSQVQNVIESADIASELSNDFKNTNTYVIMQGLADLIPQMVLAELTGGIGGLAGKAVGYEAAAASATTKAGLEMARQAISSVGFMGHDMYEANMSILDQVEGLTAQEKQKTASRLAFMQSMGVGVGGSLVGGALGSALGKAGLLDGQIGRILSMDGISQGEIRALLQKSANLLKNGSLKEYVAATGKDISKLLTEKWGSNASDILRGIAKSGGGSALKSGVGEGFEEYLFEPLTQYAAEQSYKAFGGDVDLDALYAKQDKEEAESRKQSGRTMADDYLSVFAVGAIANGIGSAKQSIFNKEGKQNEMVNQALLVAMKDMPEFEKQMAKYKKSQLANLDPKSEEYTQKSQALDKIEQDALSRIELIKNGGSNNKGEVTTFDTYSKMTKGQVDGELVGLLGRKADLELEYQALSPSKGELDAIKRKNSDSEEGAKTTFTTAQKKKQDEIDSVQSEINTLVEANSKTLSSRYQGLKNWLNKSKEQSPDQQIDEQISNIRQRADERSLTVDDIAATETVQNMTSEERNAIQSEIDSNPDSQVQIAEKAIAELESKKIDSQREVANKQTLASEDLRHNSELRTPEGKKVKKTDDNNIAFRKDRQYAYATEEQVNSLAETKGKGLRFEKGSTKGTKTDYVVEKVKDENGNTRTRVYERTDEGFEVVSDEIGDKALLNKADKRNIENTRYKSASVKAENKREEIIAKVAQGNRNYLPAEVENALSKDKEYQKLVKESQDLAPASSFWGDVTDTINTIKKGLLPDTSKIDKAVRDKIKELKKKKEIEEVEC